MNRKARRSERAQKRRSLLEFDRMEARALLASFTVTNTSPLASMPGSLGYEIDQSNATVAMVGSPNVIQFNIAASGPQAIALTQQLPDITQPTDIQGYTEPGSSANTNPLTGADNAVLTIILTGGGDVANGLSFDLAAAGGGVEGVDFEGFTNNAITINANTVSVSGDFIGVAPNGTPTASTTNTVGIYVAGAAGGTIGGPAAAARNVITGDTYEAVEYMPSGVVYPSNNAIEGNFIGTEADGTTLPADMSVRNGNGVIEYAGSENTIGGTASGSGNVISGSLIYGIGTGTSTGLALAGDVIQSNGSLGVLLIASPDASISASTIGGTAAGQGNSGQGIFLESSIGLTVGGTGAGAGDLIAGNSGDGFQADSGSATAMVVGSTITGNAGRGLELEAQGSAVGDLIQSNAGGGVLINGAPGSSVKSSTIGGATTALGNGTYGVSVTGSSNVTLGGSGVAGLSVLDNTGAGITIAPGSTGLEVLGSTVGGGNR